MNSINNKHQRKSVFGQDGLVSFIVVIVLMFVLTIIVISFSKLVNREQAQTLDRQLTTQAFYAAESGVNDAIEALSSGTVPSGNYNTCTGAGSFMKEAGLDLVNELGNGISYSCLLVDDTPDELVYDNISTSSSTVIPLNAVVGSSISSIEISWQNADKTKNSISGCGADFPDTPTNCEIGVLRAELLKWNGSPDRTSLIDNQGVVFASPKDAATNTKVISFPDISSNKIGTKTQVDCGTGTGTKICTLKITGFGSQKGYLRLRSIYRDSSVTIRAFDGIDRLELTGAQVEVDATGRASGVVKRIKVARSIKSVDSGNPLPEFALQTKETQCKRFTWRTGNVVPQPPAGGHATADDCDPTKP